MKHDADFVRFDSARAGYQMALGFRLVIDPL